MAGKRNKKKAETVYLVCEETGDYNYIVRRKPGGEKLKLSELLPPSAQAHDPRRKEKVSDLGRRPTCRRLSQFHDQPHAPERGLRLIGLSVR